MANDIDARLERLVAASEALLEANRQQGQQQRENHEQIMAEQRQRHEQVMAEQRQRHEQAMAVTERQAENIRSLTGAVAELARSVTVISKNQPPLLETARRGTRASEVTELLLTRVLDELREVRDAVDELRQR